MKRFLVSSALVGLLACSSPVFAADELGLYVEPKLIWEQQNFSSDGMNYGFTTLDSLAGVSKSKDDSVVAGALALGYDFSPKFSVPIRTEIEYALHAQSKYSETGAYAGAYGTYAVSHTRKTNISTLFANVFYDIKTGTNFTPYIGGGLGVAFIHTKDNFSGSGGYYGGGPSHTTKSSNNFAWNFGAGVAYSFDNNWKLDLGYRYSDFGKAKGGIATDAAGYSSHAQSHLTSHEVMLGLRYSF